MKSRKRKPRRKLLAWPKRKDPATVDVQVQASVNPARSLPAPKEDPAFFSTNSKCDLCRNREGYKSSASGEVTTLKPYKGLCLCKSCIKRLRSGKGV